MEKVKVYPKAEYYFICPHCKEYSDVEDEPSDGDELICIHCGETVECEEVYLI